MNGFFSLWYGASVLNTDPANTNFLELLKAQKFSEAAVFAIETWGSEIAGFLVAVHRDRDEASEVYSMFLEDLFRSTSQFRGECNAKNYCYLLARHASCRFFNSASNKHNAHLTTQSQLAAFERAVHSEKPQFLHTSFQNLVERLKERLTQDERALLVLRVDKEFSFDEIETIHRDIDGASSAVLRKRYERIREKLKTWVAEERSNNEPASLEV